VNARQWMTVPGSVAISTEDCRGRLPACLGVLSGKKQVERLFQKNRQTLISQYSVV